MPKGSESQTIPESEVREDWLDRVARFNQHFGRFARDAFGVVLLAAAFMILLGLAGFTYGVLLTPAVDKLAEWFGWGAYLVVFAIAYCGYALLRRGMTPLLLPTAAYSSGMS